MRNLSYIALFISIILLSCTNETSPEATNTGTTVPAAPAQSSLDEAGTSKLMTVVTDYYALKDALVATDPAKADEAADKLAASTDSLKIFVQTDSVNSALVLPYLDTVSTSSRQIIAEKDETTEKKRIHFEKISDAMYALLKKVELKNAGVYRQYCPMAFNDKGAYWLSHEEEIKNPYFGKKMLECGEVTDSLK